MKSKYFEPDSGEDEYNSTSSDELEDSGYEEEESAAVASDGSEDDMDSELSEDDEKAKKRGRGPPRTSDVSAKGSKGSAGKQELWKAGVSAGLGHGTQVIMKKPRARAEGDTPYSDDTIHPNTMLFLQDLKENNNRQWLKRECMIFLPDLVVLCEI